MMGEASPTQLAEELKNFMDLAEKDRVWKEEFASILTHTADSSELLYGWDMYRELIKSRLLHIVTLENERAAQAGRALDADAINQQLRVIGKNFQALHDAPFTIQRVCELAMYPGNGQHKSIEKYLRAVEKVLCVHSTQAEQHSAPTPPPEDQPLAASPPEDTQIET